MLTGTYTALITPFRPDGSLDEEGMERLIDYQAGNGVEGLLAAGTTGETPALSHQEYEHLLGVFHGFCGSRVKTMASCGKYNFEESLSSSRLASELGFNSILLVEPYYNGPSSLEIRREYMGPIAEALPDMTVVPYVIPGRTGTQLMPQDLALLHEEHEGVNTVKEATGSLDNMRLTRKFCGSEFSIMSGDDSLTYQMMSSSEIGGNGVISVMSNVFPKHVSEMVRALMEGEVQKAQRLEEMLAPWFGLVTVKVEQDSRHGPIPQKFRNPLPVKTIMQLFGMPSGGCRRPLGKLSSGALDRVIEVASQTVERTPELLAPVEDAFDVDISSRLENRDLLRSLCYAGE